jgi:hypothetical protein
MCIFFKSSTIYHCKILNLVALLSLPPHWAACWNISCMMYVYLCLWFVSKPIFTGSLFVAINVKAKENVFYALPIELRLRKLCIVKRYCHTSFQSCKFCDTSFDSVWQGCVFVFFTTYCRKLDRYDGLAYCCIMFIPRFVKLCYLVQNLQWVDMHLHRQCVLVYMYANNVKDRWVHSSKNSC